MGELICKSVSDVAEAYARCFSPRVVIYYFVRPARAHGAPLATALRERSSRTWAPWKTATSRLEPIFDLSRWVWPRLAIACRRCWASPNAFLRTGRADGFRAYVPGTRSHGAL